MNQIDENSAYTDKSKDSIDIKFKNLDNNSSSKVKHDYSVLEEINSNNTGSNGTKDLDFADISSDTTSNYNHNDIKKLSKIILKLNLKIKSLNEQIDVMNEELDRLKLKDINILEKNLRSSKIEIESLHQRSVEYRERIQELEDMLFVYSKNNLFDSSDDQTNYKKVNNNADKLRQLETKNNHLMKLNNSYKVSINQLQNEIILLKEELIKPVLNTNHVRYATIENSSDLNNNISDLNQNLDVLKAYNSEDTSNDRVDKNLKNPFTSLSKSQQRAIDKYIQNELNKVSYSYLLTIKELSNELNKYKNNANNNSDSNETIQTEIVDKSLYQSSTNKTPSNKNDNILEDDIKDESFDIQNLSTNTKSFLSLFLNIYYYVLIIIVLIVMIFIMINFINSSYIINR